MHVMVPVWLLLMQTMASVGLSSESQGNNFTSNENCTSGVIIDDEFNDSAGQYTQRYFRMPHMIVALVIMFSAIISNCFSLAAVFHTRGKMTSHFRLLVSLAIADIFVAVSALMFNINRPLNPLLYDPGYGPEKARLKSMCLFMVLKAMNNVGLNITLLNLMGMAVDHYIAILRPLHHTSMMNGKRTSFMILCLWMIAFLCGFSDFLCPLWEYSDYMKYRRKFNYCEFVWLSKYQEEFTVFAIALICFVTMIAIYARIYIRVWRHQKARSSSQQASARSKKALITTLLIIGTFVLCWLPTCLLNITLITITQMQMKLPNDSVLKFIHELEEKYFFNLLLLNGVCDPFIYAVRIREIQIGYRIIYSRCCSLCMRHSKYHRNSFTQERPSSFGLSTMMEDPTRTRLAVTSLNSNCSFKMSSLAFEQSHSLLGKSMNKTLSAEMYA